ncbi:MAG: 50S ribosomal protein L25/general stress protein Ctc [Bacteroidota bacterium]|jgi:large subunit ribosomal protein L25
MKSFQLTGTKRTVLTKQETKKLRDADMVPCVLYGGSENVHFSAPTLDFRGLVYTPEVFTVNIDIDGKTHQAVMQEIQFHPVTDKLMHIDFLEINPGKPVVINLPVKINGTSEGQRQGGKLVTKVRKLKVRSLINHLPDAVNVDINALQIGQSIRVGDLKIEGVEFLDSPNNILVGIRTTRNVVENPAADAKASK